MKRPSALLINPFIYDFAAYNFWSSPVGLLYVGSILRENGFEVMLIDCMESREEGRKNDGRAPFVNERVAKPVSLNGIKRHYRRYGMSPDVLKRRLSEMNAPDIILVTSIMTYWYRGTQEVLQLTRELFPESKIVVGGIYPTLCDHLAKDTLKEADLVVKANEMGLFYAFLEKAFLLPISRRPRMNDLDTVPFPCYDLYGTIPFVPLLTSFGCAFKCTYCATPYMYPATTRRTPASVIKEIKHWQSFGVYRYVIYDDSFLHDKERYAKPLLRDIQRLALRPELYNPNAMNAAFIDNETADLLAGSGFKEVRIGLESIDPETQKNTGGKVTVKNFRKAMAALADAGYGGNIFVYIMAGLPLQRWEEVQHTIDYVAASGGVPYLAEYTPIPHTVLFERHHKHARYPITEDAIYQNNALFPFAWEGFTDENMRNLKKYLNDVRKQLNAPETSVFSDGATPSTI